LHIHHIVPIRRFDSYERANQKKNLSVLCAECHQEVEGMEEPPEDVINEAFDEADLG
jgi:predicted HNH restriction endonuclease